MANATYPDKGGNQNTPLNSIKLNMLANFLGRGWTALLGILLVPIYIRIIGIEAYGLIGAFAALQALLGLLDMGLSTTLNREMARSGAGEVTAESQGELVHTLEIVYWIMSGLILLIMLGATPFVAKHWVHAQSLGVKDMILAGSLMGLTMALQWPQSLYNGGLLGLERHVLLNQIAGFINFLKYVGVLPVLWFVSPTLQAYLAWQVLVAVLGTLTLRVALWRLLPDTSASYRFSWNRLREVWRFAAGMNLITLMTIPLSQLDKVILSRILSLEAFGYYTVASQLAMVTSVVIAPVFTSYFPRFCRLVSLRDNEALAKNYHAACQFVAAIITPMALALAFFSPVILHVWSGDSRLVEHVAPIASLLVLGNMVNGYMNIPYALTLAYGWTRFAIVQNAFIALVLAPVMVWAAVNHGAIGAASVWLAVNSVSVLIGGYFLHRRLMPQQMSHWYVWDVASPLIISGLSLGLIIVFIPQLSVMPELLVSGAFVGVLTVLLLFTLPNIRGAMQNLARRYGKRVIAKVSYGNTK
ncbi:MAG: lipopolysaccharide biosynthesis protein [Methylophilaceae bacterium]